MKRMNNFQSRRNYLYLCLALMHSYVRRVKAEEASILEGATVPTALDSRTPDGDVFLNGSFKSTISSLSTSNPVDIEAVLA